MKLVQDNRESWAREEERECVCARERETKRDWRCDAVFTWDLKPMGSDSPYLDPIYPSDSALLRLLLLRWWCTHHPGRMIRQDRRTTLRTLSLCRGPVCVQGRDIILAVLQRCTPPHGSRMGHQHFSFYSFSFPDSRSTHLKMSHTCLRSIRRQGKPLDL